MEGKIVPLSFFAFRPSPVAPSGSGGGEGRAHISPEKGFLNMSKKILLLSTGGTIASAPTEHGLAPAVDGRELLSRIAPSVQQYQLESEDVLNLDSSNIQPEEWQVIARRVYQRHLGYDGIVITHGTDTMAYTAAALSYLIQYSAKPIVLTGAQRPLSDAITDARRNLRDSVRFALHEGVRGVYLVFDGKAILGTRARKVRSKSYNAFESINYPVAAFIDERRILQYVEAPCAPQPGVQFYDALCPCVCVLKLIPGMRPDTLRYLGKEYDAILIESYGVGGIPFHGSRNFMAELAALTNNGKVVVLATQVMLEGSDAEVYEVGFEAVNRYNVLQAYDMTVEAASVKLMWAMAQTHEFEQVKRLFYQNINNDILTL